MQVFLYNFAKRNRSTLTTQSSGTALNCTLKEATSITKPVLLFQTVEAFTYNYCYIPDFGRFYFISSVQSVERMWEVACTEDYLASFKTEIGATSANILYAHGSTKNIPDQRIPVTANLLKGHNFKALDDMVITEGQGAVIVGITGKGSFGSYLLQYNSDINEMLDGIDSWASFITDNWTFTKQLFFGGSASECLRSAIAIPLVFGGSDVSDSEAEALSLGNYPCKTSGNRDIKGYHITKPILKYSDTINIPWQSTDWRRVSTYTDISLYLPMIGMVNIPATELMNDTSLTVKYAINVTSGDISCEISGTQSEIKVGVASGNCAMATAYGSTGIDTNKMTNAVAMGAGVLTAMKAASLQTRAMSYAAQVAIGAGIAGAASETIDALGGNGQGSGGLGGGSSHGLDKVMHIFVTQKELSDTQAHFNEIMGKPYMAVGTPNQFTGYVQTDGFQFKSTKAYSEEKDMINQLMDSGIYYE